MILLNLIILVIISVCNWYVSIYWKSRKLAKHVNCPEIHPIFGNLTLFSGNNVEITKKFFNLMLKNYNKTLGFWKGPYFFICLVTPEDVELLLKDNANKIDKSDDYRFFKAVIGDSTFTLGSGPKFKLHKRIIMPWLRINNLKNLIICFNNKSDELIKVLKSHTRREFDVYPYISLTTIKSLTATILGLTVSEIESIHLTELVDRLTIITMEKIYKFWLRNDIFFILSGLKSEEEKCLKQFDHVINLSIFNSKHSQINNNFDVLVDVLVKGKMEEGGAKFLDEDIRNELKTMFIAGHGTSTNSLCFVFCLLGLYENIQEDLYDEVNSVLGQDWDGIVTYEHITKFKLMERILQETWRLYPSGSVFGKKVVEDITDFNGITIPKGTEITICANVLHRNPDVYPDPDKFDPDRFLPENSIERNPYSFLPFSTGNRACIGKNYTRFFQKVVIAKIIKNFKIYSKVAEKDFQLVFEAIMKRADGYPVIFKSR